MKCARLTTAVVAFVMGSTALADSPDNLLEPALTSWPVPLYWVPPDKPDKPVPEVVEAEPMSILGAVPTDTLPFVGIPPCRILDTRGNGAPIQGGIFANGESRNYLLPGICGIPADAQAVSLNITVTQSPSAPPAAFLLAWPLDGAIPPVSILNFQAGQTVANAAIVPLGTNGGITVNVSHSTHVIIDTNGYFGPALNGLFVNEGQANSITSAMIVDGTIVNADINASAAIADTKLATITTAGKVADTALSANVTRLGQTIEAGEITNIPRTISFPLTSFLDCEGPTALYLKTSSALDNRADYDSTGPGSGPDGGGFSILFDSFLSVEDQNTEICSQFAVPEDYVSGGQFRILTKKSADTGATEVLNCAVGKDVDAMESPGLVTLVGSAAVRVTCVPTLPAGLTAGDTLRFYLSITSSATMNDNVRLYSVAFEYTASQ